MRVMLAAALGAGVALLGGCSSEPAVIAGISDTEVTIRQASGTPDSAVTAEASEGCALYGKTATPINYTCSSSGCRTRFHLFACTTPELADASRPLVETGAAPRATTVALPVEPPRPMAARPTTTPDDDFWNRPYDGPVVVRATGATSIAPAVAEPPPAEFFSDDCSQYLNDQAMHLRCQTITGPDRDQFVPPAGMSASLAEQMRCHPLREDPVGYEVCLHRHAS